MNRETIDRRVRHAGKAGAHHTRTQDTRRGTRKPRRQPAKHLRWRTEA